jgi:DNA integrity scanning protein DisA with diadenylate cyclase activity
MAKQTQDHSKAIIEAALQIAKKVKASALLVYAEAVEDSTVLNPIGKTKTRLILIARENTDQVLAKELSPKYLSVPNFDLTRMGQIKMATLLAFSQRMIKPGETFVFLTGLAGKPLDTIMTMSVGEEYEIFQSVDQPELTEHIRRVVFERVLSLAMALANEGREGKPVGTIFVLGDTREVQKYSQQAIMNPFKGYTEKERNILDDNLRETVKEFSTIDGAFLIKGNGVIVSCGTLLRPTLPGKELPQGLGARHAAAAAITATTKSIAISLSESTGDVRVWRRGQLITEIEKAPRAPKSVHDMLSDTNGQDP